MGVDANGLFCFGRFQDAFSLLAYSDCWNSPVGYQLEHVQREPVCAALNSAILGSYAFTRPPCGFLRISPIAEKYDVFYLLVYRSAVETFSKFFQISERFPPPPTVKIDKGNKGSRGLHVLSCRYGAGRFPRSEALN